jgi:hypothetical protein
MRLFRDRLLKLAVAGLVAVAACNGAPTAPGTCQQDVDCTSGEVCDLGVCVASPAGHDGGTVHHDGGTVHHDGGTVHHDAGQPMNDDAGQPMHDDAGQPMNDDAGQPMNDAGPPDAGQTMSGGAITCRELVTSYKANGRSCGSERWSVKTGTDNDVQRINLTPQDTTIAQLASMPYPAQQSAMCTRNGPGETQVWTLRNVNLHFVRLESDSDYHIVASDGMGNSMIVEAVWPGCVGHVACSSNQSLLCEITHARAAADVLETSGRDSIGTVMGVGFFDFKHGQNGVAPNAIELHPILAVCFGQDCDPLQGY